MDGSTYAKIINVHKSCLALRTVAKSIEYQFNSIFQQRKLLAIFYILRLSKKRTANKKPHLQSHLQALKNKSRWASRTFFWAASKSVLPTLSIIILEFSFCSNFQWIQNFENWQIGQFCAIFWSWNNSLFFKVGNTDSNSSLVPEISWLLCQGIQVVIEERQKKSLKNTHLASFFTEVFILMHIPSLSRISHVRRI